MTRFSLMSWMKSEWPKIEKIKKSALLRACTVEVSCTWTPQSQDEFANPKTSEHHFHTLSVQINKRDTFNMTVNLPIVLHARSIVSSHFFSLYESLRLLQLTSYISSSWSLESFDLTSSQSERTLLHMLNQTWWFWFWKENLRYFKSYSSTWSTMFCTCQISAVDT